MPPAVLDHSSRNKHHPHPVYHSNIYIPTTLHTNERQMYTFVTPTTIMNEQPDHKSTLPNKGPSSLSSTQVGTLLRDFPSAHTTCTQISKAEKGRAKKSSNKKSNDVSQSSLPLQSYLDEANDKTLNRTSAAISNEEKGLCIKCGTQLYQIKTQKTGLFQQKTKEVKVPLSIPGQVERGHCLQCGISTSSTTLDVAADPSSAHIQGKNSSNRGSGSISPSSYASDDDKQVGVPGSSTNTVISSQTNAQSKANYQGSFNVYGERDGHGVMTWDNGDVYTGEFFNGNRHGHGTLVFHDGTEYVGEWECNLQHGIGTRRWNNGDCYTGQYQNGKRTGEGRFYYSNGDMYIGLWVSGVMHGPGRYYYASGQRFEGLFVDGKRQGKGKLQRTDGSLDVGVYINDIRRGIGVRWSADRTMAWKMMDGTIKKKITIPEAVAMDYDIDSAAEAAMNISSPTGVV
jgi:hypothetical protein